jgi:hypothetical protein
MVFANTTFAIGSLKNLSWKYIPPSHNELAVRIIFTTKLCHESIVKISILLNASSRCKMTMKTSLEYTSSHEPYCAISSLPAVLPKRRTPSWPSLSIGSVMALGLDPCLVFASPLLFYSGLSSMAQWTRSSQLLGLGWHEGGGYGKVTQLWVSDGEVVLRHGHDKA